MNIREIIDLLEHFDEEDEHPDAGLFRAGYCHALAIELHVLTGAPIVALEAKEGRRWAIIHVMVETSPNIFLDIDGERSLDDILYDADIDPDEVQTRVVEVDESYLKAMSRRGVVSISPEIKEKAKNAAEWVLRSQPTHARP